MPAYTIFERGFPSRPVMRVAHSPFLRNLAPITDTGNLHLQRQIPSFDRYITVGHQLSPDTGAVIGRGVIPLPNIIGTNESISVYGETGSGKSLLMRTLIEYYSAVEHRCVIIFDPTKNQYWSFNKPQNRPDMVRTLKENGIEPISLKDIEVYTPIYDLNVVGLKSIERDYHSDADHLISIRMSALTSKGFFELGDVDPQGRVYQGFMDAIMNVSRSEKTVTYLTNQLNMLMMDKSKSRSVASLKNIFEPLVQQNIISDNGTDVKRMLHHPRTDGTPGKISVISMATSEPNDRRRNALVSSICSQIYEYIKNDIDIKPVIVVDEAREFIGNGNDVSPATFGMFGRLHLQGRAWGRAMVYGYQDPEDVKKFFGGRKQSPININLSKSITLSSGKDKLMGTGYGRVFINGTGDPKIPDMDFLIKTFPCRTRHID